MKTAGNSAKEAIKACIIDVRITITGIQLWEVQIGHPHDRTPIKWETSEQTTNHHQEFCYTCRYDYKHNR